MRTIHVVAALVTDPRGRTLVVRKAGTTTFMNPGGKPEPGESAVEALRRELGEEVGLAVAAADLEPLGTFSADAANERDHRVQAEVFRLRLSVPDHVIGAEIVESLWLDPDDPGDVPLAPLATEHLLALLSAT
jgi:8-oxo-dGTP pyrophosphatase MutT (NUDIX family)